MHKDKDKGKPRRMTVDFLVRRLQENGRTLAILTLKIEESFPNEFELISDLNKLHLIVTSLQGTL